MAPPGEALATERAAALADFARTCKGAARTVSLYPRTHPSIGTSLQRLTGSTARLGNGNAVTVTVHPDKLLVDGKAAARTEPVVSELATLLHQRLIGELSIEQNATADDWHALLLLLASSPDDLIAAGGVASAWAATGQQHFTIRQIDYAEVLREHGHSRDADWDHIIACCLNSASALDDRALAALLEAIADPEQFAALIERLQRSGTGGELPTRTRASALLQMLRYAMDALIAKGGDPECVLRAAADALPRLTPEMILAIVGERASGSAIADVADGIVSRITDESIAGFVATSIEVDRGATERLAQALEALVPDAEQKDRILELAETTARQAIAGNGAAFEALWQGAKQMLLSYSDTNFVSTEYARELSAARQQAIEVEHTSDDPPERIEAWIASISEAEVRQLDLLLLYDLLRIESDPAKWAKIADVAVPEIERHTTLGNIDGARGLVEPIAADAADSGRWDFAAEARKALQRLAAGPLVRHVVQQLRKVEDAEAQRLQQLCHAIGPLLIRPLAEALAAEDNTRSVRRLRDLLLGFGAAGHSSVEQLKSSSNPAVRRTAVDLLRVFGGSEALPQLASMLDDPDPHVQREAVRAIVQIASPEAYAILQCAFATAVSAREAMIRELIELRDERAIPVLCDALDQTMGRGAPPPLQATIVDALGGLGPHPDAVQALKRVLHAGAWWAPLRTAAARKLAAASLRRIGSPEAIEVLRDAAETGSRGVRSAAGPEVALASRRERDRV
jgi:hypothetical protein